MNRAHVLALLQEVASGTMRPEDAIRRLSMAPFESLEARCVLAGEVVINEIHYNPDIETQLVEFIELYNTTTAAIDLSDGLSGDAGHVARASGVALRLESEAIPIHPAARDTASRLHEDPHEWAIHGGEEFELLLCAPAGAVQPHAAAFVERFDLGLTRIGRVDEGEGVWMRDQAGREGRLHARSYDHFRVEG